jgi:hypothetical protein
MASAYVWCTFSTPRGRECLGSGSVARGDSDQPVAEHLGRLDDSVIGNASRAEDADLECAN